MPSAGVSGVDQLWLAAPLCAVCSPGEAPAVLEAPHGWLEVETLAPEGLLSVLLRPPWKQDMGMLSVFQAWSGGAGFKLLLSLLLLGAPWGLCAGYTQATACRQDFGSGSR